MSRIGKKLITLAENVTLTVSPSNEVTVKGPKGELKEQLDRDIKVEVNGNEVTLIRPTEQIRHKAMHGLYRSLINNMVIGVSQGYELKLELVGVGYRAAVNGQQLDMALGYSHNIIVELPKEVSGIAVMEKGKAPLVTLSSIDKQLVGQVAAKIRSLRKPEPYKGKGVRFQGEIIRRKAGKTAGK
ncbi:50S ribosomal protein L6 [Taibaiella sp. KBW10]|uniref:50S ribosomal protein L6 n=1 Tax=Taibaiella sp. KBW10 TaxID=2153357 RepID=UPI000F5A2218|nr:50S ribosomal protein L6 [Taibaiella sp. KBW10]RQO31904.1 50S ribosomal protein L6 [Taibaiella sp. KBW10]